MYIAINVVWHVVINHMRYIVDIKTTRRDVGCNEHGRTTLAKRAQRLFAVALTAIAVNRRCRQTFAVQKVFERVGRAPRTRALSTTQQSFNPCTWDDAHPPSAGPTPPPGPAGMAAGQKPPRVFPVTRDPAKN
jgi:hypothetical protein